VTHGAIAAFKLEGSDGKYKLVPAWMSRDMNRAEPPIVANKVVYAYGSGEYTEQAYPDRGLFDNSPLRVSRSTHAVLHALDAETGKELYSSGDQITSFSHFSGLSVANGRVYIDTYDGTLYCFGLADSQK
jgi:outer membrane protein assembly factor BamB